MVIDTLARALFDSGDAANAVIEQLKAIDIAPNDETRAQFQETLALYEAGT